ncbi:conserved oligomeric Golgi complex subunit 3 [Frankliniella occidentalis]|uniref:Conserved oligomeric Golgi complex subunit 3 n=1 Tax=Frankliniella occidentalis TaxID=133901 RepID=A0A6J1SJS9_FRAOC|nr:conserved oligomeric Golgi complex subunit 3 [Frankliniella occidentalis]
MTIMADVANTAVRQIQNKLLEWEQSENSLAPLSLSQRNAIYEISEEVSVRSVPTNLPEGNLAALDIKDNSEDEKEKESISNTNLSSEKSVFPLRPKNISTTHDFLEWHSSVEEQLEDQTNAVFISYLQQMTLRRQECDELYNQVEACLKDLSQLSKQHQTVANSTNSLHQVSEQLLADQMKLSSVHSEVERRLQYFRSLDRISQRLESPTLSINSTVFKECLDRLDECIEYMATHENFKESRVYLAKLHHCQSRAVALVRSYVTQIMQTATQQCLAAPVSSSDSFAASGGSIIPAADSDFARCYGKFQACAPRIRAVLGHIEERVEKVAKSGYEQLLVDCQACYVEQRHQLLWSSVCSAVRELSQRHKGDHCTMVRSGCAFLLHICQDEHRLFAEFFRTQVQAQLTDYLEGLCTSLYDVLRPAIIHINHLETLAEICSILRVEMLEEHVPANPGPLEAFGRVVWQLLQDVQERLVFRAHLYLQSDILNYKPAPGDLAYPEKLEMMESIAQSIAEQQSQQSGKLRRSDSRSSLASVGSATSQEVANINHAVEQPRSRTGNSPADLHGMWYPTVRRTLVCLSRLYRCVERPIFQGLSQEALSMCMQSVTAAAEAISQRKTAMDGELFEVKHLLILREQIAPFQVDFTIRETSLDFSKVKTAAFGLLQRRRQLLSLNANNALLEFLLDGTPAVREQLIDSRRDVDLRLKTTCEKFIASATSALVGPLQHLLAQVQSFLKMKTEEGDKLKDVKLRQQQFALPEAIGSVVRETQKLMKTVLPALQRSMQLYLANKDTEAILYRPIKNNVVSHFAILQQHLISEGYSAEDMMVVACPTPEQVQVMLSSASLIAAGS